MHEWLCRYNDPYNTMTQNCIQFHSEVAEKHGKFIKMLLQCAKACHDSGQSSDIFCMWLIMASYHRAIHLLEALFILQCVPTALSDLETYCIDNWHKAEYRRDHLLQKHTSSAIQQAFKSLRRLAFHVENFPNCGMDDFGAGYDAVTDFERTKVIVLDGHLAKIENAILPELKNIGTIVSWITLLIICSLKH